MMEQFKYDGDSEVEIHLFGVAQLNAEMVGQVNSCQFVQSKVSLFIQSL